MSASNPLPMPFAVVWTATFTGQRSDVTPGTPLQLQVSQLHLGLRGLPGTVAPQMAVFLKSAQDASEAAALSADRIDLGDFDAAVEAAIDAKDQSIAALQAAIEAIELINPENFLPIGGGALLGHLETIAGATGAQVPQAQEVVPISGGVTLTGHLSTIAGATGNQIPRANEIFGKGQTFSVVARSTGVIYTNSSTKPIIVLARGTTSVANGYIVGYVAGVKALFASISVSGVQIGSTIIVPPGATYLFETGSITGFAVSEYA